MLRCSKCGSRYVAVYTPTLIRCKECRHLFKPEAELTGKERMRAEINMVRELIKDLEIIRLPIELTLFNLEWDYKEGKHNYCELSITKER